MRMLTMFIKALPIVFCFLLLDFNANGSGGDDHKHGDAKATAPPSGKKYFTSEAISDKHELFIKFQPIEVGEETILQLFISEYQTNKPLDSVTLKIISKEDKNLKFTIARADRGYYEIKATFPEKKIYSLSVSIN